MGLAQAPFILNGALDYHFDNYNKQEKEIVQTIKDDLYVDDVIGGATTTIKANIYKESATIILKDATFTLHRWHSNDTECEHDEPENTMPTETTVFGVKWDKIRDIFSVKFPEKEEENTKRGILRYLASAYDPLGLASPITLTGKVIYRDTCDRKLGGDERLCDDLAKMWRQWLTHLPIFLEISRPIPTFRKEIHKITLNAFSDASYKGTSAAVYVVVYQASGVSQGLLFLKTLRTWEAGVVKVIR